MKKRSCILALVLSATLCFGTAAFAEAPDLTIEQEELSVDLSDELVDISIPEVASEGEDHDQGPDATLIHGNEDEHKLGDCIYKVDPTCTKPGLERYLCADFPTHFHEFFIDPLGHRWSSTENPYDWGRIIKEPTCTETGLAEDYCLECGEVNPDIQPRVIAPLGHDFTKKVVDREANCLEPELYHYECARANCDASEGITYEGGTDPTAHDWDEWLTEKPATCAETGVAVRWCKRCGEKQQKTLAKLQPKWKLVRSTLKNCFDTQYEYVCEHCNGEVEGHTWVEDCPNVVHAHVFKYLPAMILNADGEYEVDPNYTGDSYLVDYELPTCTEPGYAVYQCIFYNDDSRHEDCDDATQTIVFDALGHKWGAWITRHEPGEGKNEYGYWIRKCDRCGEIEERIAKEAPEDLEVTKNGLVLDEDGRWRLYENGIFRDSFTGIVEYDGAQFFVTNGIMDAGANGLNLYNGVWYFLAAGKVLSNYNGVVSYDGQWFMVKNGILDTEANGLFDYDGGRFLFAAGRLRNDVIGLWQDFDGTWYFLDHGQVAWYDGVVPYDNALFLVLGGKLATNYEAYNYEYNGHKYRVDHGQLYID